MVKIILRKSILILAILFIDVNLIFACSCVGIPTKEAAQNADLIFIGNVVELSPIDPKKQTVKFAIQHVYKGVADEKLKFENTPGEKDCAGINFETGKGYLVFAQKQPNGAFSSRMCSHTALLTQAINDISIIQAMFTPDTEQNEQK